MGGRGLVHRARSVYSTAPDTAAAVAEVVEALGDAPSDVVVFFASPALDTDVIAGSLVDRFGTASVIGCTTAGEFTQERTGSGGVSVVALPEGVVRRAAGALVDLGGDVAAAVREAVRDIESQLDVRLRELDPTRYVGLILIDGLHGDEELVNETLGDLAPLLSFVGGSAGDDLKFAETKVYYGATGSTRGAVLLLLDLAVPFTIVKTCSFVPAGRTFLITEADVPQRIVWQFDGRPAAEVYAEATGHTVDDLDSDVFMSHPVGLMDDGQPWIRSPQQVVDGRGIKFYCQILPDMEVELMSSTRMVQDTAAAMREAVEKIGGKACGAVMFNCILRRLEMDANRWHQDFVDALSGVSCAGFHTYGESWLGHINQTLTAVVFGEPEPGPGQAAPPTPTDAA